MRTQSFGRMVFGSVLAALAFGVVASPVLAQRDPAFDAARAAGQVGEMMNGYVGIITDVAPTIQAMVNDINQRRRAVYTARAQAEGVTLEAYAMAVGCQAIARTVPGEKYEAPDGSWQTRTTAPPIRDPRCA